MGAAACLVKELGLEVEGADLSFSPPMSTYLDEIAIPCHDLNDIDGNFLKKFDLVIVGNSVPRNSSYAKTVEESGVPFTSFPTVLGAFVLKDRTVVGLAGTHGKTTTTYFMTQLFEKLGEKPGYLIGGIVEGRPPSCLGKSKYFFIESDEYDSAYFQKISKFRLYYLSHMILTSLEFDHGDIFDSLEDIEAEFEAIFPEVANRDGSFIISHDYLSSKKLGEALLLEGQQVSFYGTSCDVGPTIVDQNADGTSFVLNLDGQKLDFKTNLIGEHNILNLSSCILFALQQGYDESEIRDAVIEIKHVKRRQEMRGLYRGAVVIDDFAHHPRAVKLTVEAIKVQYPNKRIMVIMDPISATARSSIFQKEFAQSLLGADSVIIARPSLKTTIFSRDDLDCDRLVKDISKSVPAICVDHLDLLRREIDGYADENSVLLVLSNRTCLGLWESDFVDLLEK